MKKYRYLLLGLLCVSLLSVGLVSCSDDDDDWYEISYGQLPPQAQVFLETYWGGYAVSSMEMDGHGAGTTYEVILTNGTQFEFDSTGLWVEIDAPMGMALPTGFIHPGIINFVSLNFPDQEINEISREYYGYEVELTNEVELNFNSNGNIIYNY